MDDPRERVLITGANKGIGRATVAAVLAARDGAEVLLGSRDAERGEEARAALVAEHELARSRPERTINACTPGFIETDMTRAMAEARGSTPDEMGMKSPAEGTRATLHLPFGDVGGSGWFFGSDAQRSPLDRYRSPGDPPYTGD